MLARFPIISAYDPSRESMLAHASPSYKSAIIITGLVIDCPTTHNFLVLQKLSTKKLTLLSHDLLIVLFSISTSSFILANLSYHLQNNFILVLGKANVKCA